MWGLNMTLSSDKKMFESSKTLIKHFYIIFKLCRRAFDLFTAFWSNCGGVGSGERDLFPIVTSIKQLDFWRCWGILRLNGTFERELFNFSSPDFTCFFFFFFLTETCTFVTVQVEKTKCSSLLRHFLLIYLLSTGFSHMTFSCYRRHFEDLWPIKS